MDEDPIGAVVRYHGSQSEAHGEYLVFGVCGCCLECAALALDLTHGRVELAQVVHQVRYRLGRIGASGPRSVVRHARRSSFTIVANAEDKSAP